MALLLLLPGPVLAQAVHGTIVDPATGERVNLVEVGVLDRSGQSLYSTLSDANGEFELPVPPGGGLRLSFKALGTSRSPQRCSPCAAARCSSSRSSW